MNQQTSQAASPNSRKSLILKLLQNEGEQQVDTLAERFGVSGMTIRRDLQGLADDGKVIRTHGGAAPAARVSFEFRFLEKVRRHAREKEQIAEVAVSLVHPGQSVILDSGTTTLAIARRLRTLEPLTVITTSLPIASELFGVSGVETVLLGGTLRKDSPDLLGAITDHNLELLKADLAFIGADAVDGNGWVYNSSAELGRMLGRMAHAAKQCYAVADSSKIGHHELLRFANLRDWSGLITDQHLDESTRRGLERLDIRIMRPSRPRTPQAAGQ